MYWFRVEYCTPQGSESRYFRTPWERDEFIEQHQGEWWEHWTSYSVQTDGMLFDLDTGEVVEAEPDPFDNEVYGLEHNI